MSELKRRIRKLEESTSPGGRVFFFDPQQGGIYRQARTGRVFTWEELQQIGGHVLIWDLPVPGLDLASGKLSEEKVP